MYDKWSEHLVKAMKHESELIGEALTHQGEVGTAREALLASILRRVLPASYAIGTGQVVDIAGNVSKQIDIVVSRTDFPQLRLESGSSLFLMESVIATIEVKSTLNATALTEALDNCRSVGQLRLSADWRSIRKSATDAGLRFDESDSTVSGGTPLQLQRFDVFTMPSLYVFGYEGYSTRLADFKAVIEDWADDKQGIRMAELPAVIAADGCFAWRNAQPLAADAHDYKMLIGKDSNPLRLLLNHLLWSLNVKIPIAPDAMGVEFDLEPYVKTLMTVPKVEEAILPLA